MTEATSNRRHNIHAYAVSCFAANTIYEDGTSVMEVGMPAGFSLLIFNAQPA